LSLFQGIRFFLLPNNDSKRSTLKSILGFRPKNIKLYEQAFTHKSIVNESKELQPSNERLEFLGDAILGAIVAEYFFKKFPYREEGELTKLRSKLVSRQFLNQLSIEIGLDTFLETSADVRRAKSIFGDAFEALIGAIYLDRGYKTTKKFVFEKVIADYINIDKVIEKEVDFKSKLLEWCQNHKYDLHYNFNEVNGSSSSYFNCELYINNKVVSSAADKSKKKASQKAAQEFLQKKEA